MRIPLMHAVSQQDFVVAQSSRAPCHVLGRWQGANPTQFLPSESLFSWWGRERKQRNSDQSYEAGEQGDQIHSHEEKVKATSENTSLNEEGPPFEEPGKDWPSKGHCPAVGWQEGGEQR